MSSNISDYGQLAAFVVVVGICFAYLRHKGEKDAEERQAERTDRAAARKEFEDTIRGIADKHATALNGNTKAIQKITRRVEHCPQRKNGQTHPIEDDEGGAS